MTIGERLDMKKPDDGCLNGDLEGCRVCIFILFCYCSWGAYLALKPGGPLLHTIFTSGLDF